MRLAVVSDVHGNLPALDAVIADLATRRVDRIVNLGDCVSGPLWPRATLERLRALDWPTVRGNHDRMVGLDAPASLSRTDAFARADLDDDGCRWLAGLPAQLDLSTRMVAFHGCPRDDDAYLLEDVTGGRLTPAAPATVAGRLAGTTARLLLCGHSHLASVLRLPDGRWIVNPGSVGCPAYDDPTPPAHVSESGSPAARYAILTLDPHETDEPTFELLAIAYDHRAASRRALACGRADWAGALSSGFASDR